MKVIEYLQVTEYLQGRYTAQEKPFGVVYRWSPERVVECRCGARPTLTTSMTTCGGMRHGPCARHPEGAAERLAEEDGG